MVHALAPAPVGGLESVVATLAPAQRAAGAEVVVALTLMPGDADPEVARRLERAGVPVERVHVAARAYLRERRLLAGICHAHGAQVLHTHGYRSDVVGAFAANALDIPQVTTVHGFTGGGLRNRFYELLQHRAAASAAAVIAVSKAQRHGLERAGVRTDRLHVIPNAFARTDGLLPRDAARRALGLEGEGPFVGWVGRLSHEKGPDLALDALARLPARVTLVFVGDGRERVALQRQAAESGVADRVVWAGRHPDAAALLAAFDVLLLSSRTEGIPMILLEAMHARLPIVASRVGGVPDMLSPGEALLCDPGSPEGYAVALESVLRDPAAAAGRAARAAERLVREHDVATWAARHIEIYARLAGRQGA